MKKYMEDRVLNHAKLFIKRDGTVRSVASETGWSKQTVHNDLSVRLYYIHLALYEKVKAKLDENKHIGRLKGGYKTQEKWLKKKERKERINGER